MYLKENIFETGEWEWGWRMENGMVTLSMRLFWSLQRPLALAVLALEIFCEMDVENGMLTLSP
jgi:hypothetical protein